MLFFGSFLFILGCQPQKQNQGTAPTRQGSPYIDHIVQYPGETLSIIANWYTGSGRNWELVLDANPGVDPRRIRLGDLIRIPRELLVREDAMPRSAVPGAGGAAPRSRPSASANTSAPARATASAAEDVDSSAGETGRTWDWEKQDAADSSVGDDSQVEESDVISEAFDSFPSDGDSAESSVVADVESPPEEVVDSSTSDMVTGYNAPTAAPSREMRIKTREELLKELLEE